jgi:phosphoenolpyruvate carboxykinase (GTP)
MLPFCGYNMADYFAHWLAIGNKADQAKLPRIYYVNWFRKSPEGRFLWPGFGENSRVLAWIAGRLEGTADGVETPLGILPTKESLPTEGLDIDEADLDTLLRLDVDVWKQEAALIPEHYETFGDRVPADLWTELEALVARLEG